MMPARKQNTRTYFELKPEKKTNHRILEFFRKLFLISRGSIMAVFIAYFLLPAFTLSLTALIALSVIAVLCSLAAPALVVLWEMDMFQSVKEEYYVDDGEIISRDPDKLNGTQEEYFYQYSRHSLWILIPLGLFIVSIFLASSALLAAALITLYTISTINSIYEKRKHEKSSYIVNWHGFLWQALFLGAVVLTSVLLLSSLVILPIAKVCVITLAIIAFKSSSNTIDADSLGVLAHTSPIDAHSFLCKTKKVDFPVCLLCPRENNDTPNDDNEETQGLKTTNT